MKKKWSLVLSLLLVFMLAVPVVSAEGKPAHTPGGEHHDEDDSVTESVYEDDQDANDDSDEDAEEEADEEEVAKGKENAKKGLEIAFQNTQGTPAATVIEAIINEEDASLAAQSLKDLVLSDEEADEDEESAETEEDAEEDLTDEDLTEDQKEAIKDMAKALKEEFKLLAKTSDNETKKQQIESLKDLMKVLEALQDNEEALDAAESVAALEPENLKNYKALGELFKSLGQGGLKAYVNGKQPEFDVEPLIKDGRTLVPVRAMVEALGADVNYDAATGTVTVTRGDSTVTLTLDSNEATIDGQATTLDVPATVIDGRTVIPLRFLSEALGTKVYYDAETGMIVVIEETETTTDTTTDTTN
jgi:hypothetical protein